MEVTFLAYKNQAPVLTILFQHSPRFYGGYTDDCSAAWLFTTKPLGIKPWFLSYFSTEDQVDQIFEFLKHDIRRK